MTSCPAHGPITGSNCYTRTVNGTQYRECRSCRLDAEAKRKRESRYKELNAARKERRSSAELAMIELMRIADSWIRHGAA
jgi:hypothetical protein